MATCYHILILREHIIVIVFSNSIPPTISTTTKLRLNQSCSVYLTTIKLYEIDYRHVC